MAMTSRAVTIATTATRIDADEGGSSTSQGASVYNAGTATVYLGGSDVTTANGYPLAVGEHLSVDLALAHVLYGIVATGTQAVRVLEATG